MTSPNNRETRIRELATRLLSSPKLFCDQTAEAVAVDGFESPIPHRLRLCDDLKHDWLDYDIAIRLTTRAASLYVPAEVRASGQDQQPLLSLPTDVLACRLDEGSDGIIDDDSYEFRLTLALEIARIPLQLLKDGLLAPEAKLLKNAEDKLVKVLNGLWSSETPEVGGASKGEIGRGDWSAALSEAVADALRDQTSRAQDGASKVTANEVALVTDRLMAALGISDRPDIDSLKTSLRRAKRAAAKRKKP